MRFCLLEGKRGVLVFLGQPSVTLTVLVFELIHMLFNELDDEDLVGIRLHGGVLGALGLCNLHLMYQGFPLRLVLPPQVRNYEFLTPIILRQDF